MDFEHYTIFSKSATPTEVKECPQYSEVLGLLIPMLNSSTSHFLVFFWLSIVFMFFPLMSVITSCMYQCVCLQKPSTLLPYPQLSMWAETPNKYNLKNYDKGDGKIGCEWGTRKLNVGTLWYLPFLRQNEKPRLPDTTFCKKVAQEQNLPYTNEINNGFRISFNIRKACNFPPQGFSSVCLLFLISKLYFLRAILDFPGGPAVKIPCFQCGSSAGLIPGQGTKIPHANKYIPAQPINKEI